MTDVSPHPQPKKPSFSIIRVLAVLGVIGLIGLLWMQHEMNRFKARSKQAEVRATLRSAMTAERSYYAEHQAYSSSLAAIGFFTESGNRYAYLFDAHGTLQTTPGEVSDPAVTGTDADHARRPEALPFDPSYQGRTYAGDAHLGVRGTCPKCDIVVAAVGNIDNDKTLDVWSIASFDRTGPHGEKIAAGEPFNEVNDIED